MRKYFYEYVVYTNNLCYGRVLIGRFSSRALAEYAGRTANRGAFDIERRRVYVRGAEVSR